MVFLRSLGSPTVLDPTHTNLVISTSLFAEEIFVGSSEELMVVVTLRETYRVVDEEFRGPAWEVRSQVRVMDELKLRHLETTVSA